ncbi:hypothetical protein BDZ85DRAFT_54783 [Elsinoe ampelina]|uniref:Uncharacterized protein n=1 Tax=Elsinoe ampelina TaxID=302913 RepID=A0A6A6GM22_9PEZI|nr:hypothetical protein BDZ85DRAFT_54783 [Elsinoe ampelina]
MALGRGKAQGERGIVCLIAVGSEFVPVLVVGLFWETRWGRVEGVWLAGGVCWRGRGMARTGMAVVLER